MHRDSDRRLWAAAMAVTLVRILLVNPSVALSAVNNCAPSVPHPLFVGATYDPGSGDYSVRGAKADVDIQTASLCTSDTTNANYSGAWSMVTSSNRRGWAQIGYLNRATAPTIVYFWQYMKDVTKPPSQQITATAIWEPVSVGADRVFRVERHTSDGKLHMFIADTPGECNVDGECAITPFDPLSANAWDSTVATWQGEAGFAGTDVPGVTTDRVNFDTVRVRLPGNNWDPLNWTSTNSSKCFYKIQVVDDGSHFRVWTEPLDHDC
jgi:hypothetical protein